MKKAKTTLLTMIWITGLCLAGSEAETIQMQFVGCSIGLMMFAGASYGLVKTLRGA